MSNRPHHPLPAKNLNMEGIRMMGTASSLYQQNNQNSVEQELEFS